MVTLKGSLTKHYSPLRHGLRPGKGLRTGGRAQSLFSDLFSFDPAKIMRDLQDAGKQITTSRTRCSHFIRKYVLMCTAIILTAIKL